MMKIIFMRYNIPTAEYTETVLFCVVEPCSLVDVYQRFRYACYFHPQRPDDGGRKYL